MKNDNCRIASSRSDRGRRCRNATYVTGATCAEFTKRSPRPYDHTGDTCLIAYSSDCDGSNRYANAGKNHQATKISDPLRCQFSYENNKNPFFRSIDR
jgi:hypothetical protein